MTQVLNMRPLSQSWSCLELPRTPHGWFEFGFDIRFDGTLALLRTGHDVKAASRALRRNLEAGIPLDWQRPWQGKLRVSRFDGSVESDVIEVPLVPFPAASFRNNGQWVVASKIRVQDGVNAYVYSTKGQEVSRLRVGERFNRLVAASDGTIWVGYSDEADHYEGPDGALPLSLAGIAHLAQDGRLIWPATDEQRANITMLECDALCLDRGAVWACASWEHEIVCISTQGVSRWQNGAFGARALAVDGDVVALAGEWHDPDRLTLLKVGKTEAEPIAEFSLGALADSTLFGMGDVIHALRGGKWHRVSVGSLLDDARALELPKPVIEHPPGGGTIYRLQTSDKAAS